MLSSLFLVNNVHALIVAYSLEDLVETAEFVVIGKVIEVSPLVPGYLLFFSDGYDRFQFDVTLSVENDLDGKYEQETIQFRIHDSREEFGMGIEDEQKFEIGERVLVFIGEKEPDSVMGDAYLVHGVTQGKYLLENGLAFGTHFPEGIDENELILEIQNIRNSKPIPEPEQDIIDYERCGPGTMLQNGVCVQEVENNSSGKWTTSYPEYLPPLKQLKLGTKFHQVDCKDGLDLVYKKADDTSACVTLETKIELIIRGWGQDDRLLLGCTPSRHDKCYPSDPQQYRKALYDYHFDDSNLPSSESFGFLSFHTLNACSENSICFGKFENGTKIRVSCDYPTHGCGVLSFDDYKATETKWKKYITVSASRIDESSLPDTITVQSTKEFPEIEILSQLTMGADSCNNGMDLCALPSGVSIDRTGPLGIPMADNEVYTISLDEKKANILLSQIDWTFEEEWIYAVLENEQRYYLLILSTFDTLKTPDVKMKLVDTFTHPVNLHQGEILNYTIQVDSWATYGAPATIDLFAVQDAKDSGIKVWIEPDVLLIPERSTVTTTLFIQAQDNAKDGIYDVRVIGHANGNLANLYCSKTICPTINIGDSVWSISTFGSGSGRWAGGIETPENTWLELDLNKKELFDGEIVEIRAFLVNNNTKKITFTPNELLISVIKTEPVGYFENLYGIEARYELDKPITLDPKSKTLLVRPFYWNQITFHNFEEEQRLDPKQYKMISKFVGENYDWSDEVWFEIK